MYVHIPVDMHMSTYIQIMYFLVPRPVYPCAQTCTSLCPDLYILVPRPVNPVPRPVNPVPRPVNPVPRPVNPVPRPVNSVPRPVNPVPRPVNLVPRPVNPVPRPVYSLECSDNQCCHCSVQRCSLNEISLFQPPTTVTRLWILA